MSQISRRLKYLARELKMPVLSLAQVNRSSEDRGNHKPRLADLRESGAIEQDADTVMLLHRPGMYEGGQEDNTIEVLIAKQRNGPTGDVTLAYLKHYMRLRELRRRRAAGGYLTCSASGPVTTRTAWPPAGRSSSAASASIIPAVRSAIPTPTSSSTP